METIVQEDVIIIIVVVIITIIIIKRLSTVQCKFLKLGVMLNISSFLHTEAHS